MVKGFVDTLDLVDDYSTRLKEAMDDSGSSVSALAKHLKVSYQAVKKVVDGKSSAFSSENNSKAAAFLSVNPDWLATGSNAAPRKISGAASAPSGGINTSTWTPQALQAAVLVNMLQADADREMVLQMINRVVLARTLSGQS